MLLQWAYKVSFLFSKLCPFDERELGNYQAGFARGKSTIDQMFSLRTILEKKVMSFE